MSDPLWKPTPEAAAAANISRFREHLVETSGVALADTDDLWRYSIDHMEDFWTAVIDYAGIAAETWGERVLIDGDKMPGAQWFPDARLNFAQNLLRRRDDADAMVFWGEDKVRRRMSFAALHEQVSVLAQALAAAGVGVGDRVAGVLPNMPEAVVAMLAATSLGATWSSCSPDFGVQGVLDRFGQIDPKIVFAADGYWYNGKYHDTRAKLADIIAGLNSVEHTIITPYDADTRPNMAGVPKAVFVGDFTAAYSPREITYAALPFDHPLYILFSSGTTGVPKCIVHHVGGALLKHATEQLFHSDVRRDDRVFFFTTCGWMMWNWLVTNLAWGATLLLYDGAPTAPSSEVLFDYADTERATLFGTSAKFIDALNKLGAEPVRTHDLSTVRVLCSTGSPLVPEGFDYVYEKIRPTVQLVSMSGGTDIMGCFCAGDPTKPVWRGEIQARCLGMAVDVFNDDGQSVVDEKGELVCTRSFPTVPLGFLGDTDGSRFHEAYFAAFPNIWTHGDYCRLTKYGGMVIYGRSDATLNPGGVRIGTAEIYRQVEKMPEVKESIVVGQEWDNDTRVVLFVTLADGVALDDALIKRIQGQVRANCTPRHVPSKVLQVADIPRTKSGKITELAVRDIIHGRPIKNQEALANPEALELFADRAELRT